MLKRMRYHWPLLMANWSGLRMICSQYTELFGMYAFSAPLSRLVVTRVICELVGHAVQPVTFASKVPFCTRLPLNSLTVACRFCFSGCEVLPASSLRSVAQWPTV